MKRWILILIVVISMISISFVTANEYGFNNANLPQMVGDLYCKLTGFTMEGDLYMGNHSIYDVWFINATYVNATYFNIDYNLTDSIYTTGNITADTFFGDWNGSSLYVPYINATADVDLGSHNFTADNITTNNLVVNSFVLSDLLPSPTLTWDLGSGANRWNYLYVANISSEYIDAYGIVASENITADIFISDGDQYCNSTNCYSVSEFLDNSVYDDWINATIDAKDVLANTSMKAYVDGLNGTWEDNDIWSNVSNVVSVSAPINISNADDNNVSIYHEGGNLIFAI